MMPFAAMGMDLEIIPLSEVSQIKANVLWYHLYLESNKNDTKGFIYKTETDTDFKIGLVVAKGEAVGRRDGCGRRDWHMHINVCKIGNKQGPTE